jgi:hypothetical protein
MRGPFLDAKTIAMSASGNTYVVQALVQVLNSP